MRVPTRKAGKYTGLKPDPHLTANKYSELKLRLEKLRKISRPRAIAEVKEQAAFGDFSENAAYGIAKGRLRGINRRIEEIEDHLKRAVIIKKTGNKNIVGLGSIVTIEADGRQKTYRILGSSETDPAAGVISHSSPLGSALIGRKINGKVILTLNGEQKKFIIRKIN